VKKAALGADGTIVTPATAPRLPLLRPIISLIAVGVCLLALDARAAGDEQGPGLCDQIASGPLKKPLGGGPLDRRAIQVSQVQTECGFYDFRLKQGGRIGQRRLTDLDLPVPAGTGALVVQVFEAPAGADPGTTFEQQVASMNRRREKHGGRPLQLPALGSVQHAASVLGNGDHVQAVYQVHPQITDSVTQAAVLVLHYHLLNRDRLTDADIADFVASHLDDAPAG
jgi:hypothetical protein